MCRKKYDNIFLITPRIILKYFKYNIIKYHNAYHILFFYKNSSQIHTSLSLDIIGIYTREYMRSYMIYCYDQIYICMTRHTLFSLFSYTVYILNDIIPAARNKLSLDTIDLPGPNLRFPRKTLV